VGQFGCAAGQHHVALARHRSPSGRHRNLAVAAVAAVAAVTAFDDLRRDTVDAHGFHHAPDFGRDLRRQALGSLVQNDPFRLRHRRAIDGPHLVLTARALRRRDGEGRWRGATARSGAGRRAPVTALNLTRSGRRIHPSNPFRY